MPPRDPRRPDRVAEAVREEIATLIAAGVKDPRVKGFVTVTAVEMDYYSFSTGSDTADTNGRAGGDAIYATENKAVDLLHPIVADVITPDCDVVWGIRAMSGKSLAGSQTPYSLDSSYTTVKVNDNVFLQIGRAHV